jgi:amino acid permease
MFETLKAFFFSIYGCFVVVVLVFGTLWCAFAYGTIGWLYPCSFVSVGAFFLYRRERNRMQAMAKADLQISSERQEEAIDEYVALINKNKKKRNEKKE